MDDFSLFFELLYSIKNRSVTNTSLGNYIDFSDLSVENYHRLGKAEYSAWKEARSIDINYLIEKNLIDHNREILQKININNPVIFKNFLYQIWQPMLLKSQLSKDEILQPLFFFRKQGADDLYKYLCTLIKCIISNTDSQYQIKKQIILTGQALHIQAPNEKILNLMRELLLQKNIIVVDDMRGGVSVQAYCLTDDGISEANTIYEKFIENDEASHMTQTNNFNIGSVNTLNNADTINNNDNSVTNILNITPQEEAHLRDLEAQSPGILKKIFVGVKDLSVEVIGTTIAKIISG